MMCTSSTPASAARSSTASMTRWRMSGRRIFGSGRLTSSNAIVSFMPGNSSAGSGSWSMRVQQRVADGAVDVVDGRQRLGRVDDAAAAGRQLLEAEVLAAPEQHRAAWSGRPRGRIRDGASACSSRISRRSRREVERDLHGAAAAGGGGVGDGVGVVVERIGGRHEAAEVERLGGLDGQVERAPAGPSGSVSVP